MRGVLVLGVVMAGLVMGTACVDADSELTAADARTFTERALEDADVGRIRVGRKVEAGVFRPESSGNPVPVWETSASVSGGNVVLFVTRRGNRAVYLNDVSDGGGALLSDEQFRRLDRFRFNPAADRQRDRLVLPGLIATLFLVGTVVLLGFAVRAGRITLSWPRR